MGFMGMIKKIKIKEIISNKFSHKIKWVIWKKWLTSHKFDHYTTQFVT